MYCIRPLTKVNGGRDIESGRGGRIFKCGALFEDLDVGEWLALAPILQGGSGLVRMNIPNVPGLVDCAAVSSRMSESDGAVVIDSIDSVWSLVLRLTILAMLILFNHHSIANTVSVRGTSGVLPLIILNDSANASILNVLPVGFESRIVDSIASEYELRWRSARGSVDRGAHGEAHGTYDAIPASVGKILTRLDTLYGNQVVNSLVSSLNH